MGAAAPLDPPATKRQPIQKKLSFPLGIVRFLMVPGSSRGSPESSGGAEVASGSAPCSARGTPNVLEEI